MSDGITFVKMQGAGNDFILVREAEVQTELGQLARRICDRRFGVGADGLMAASMGKRGVRMRYRNADGSCAAVCGNGLRCFARYASESRMAQGDAFLVETDAGEKTVRLCRGEDGGIRGAVIEMGRPDLLPYEIPVLLPGRRIIDRALIVEGRTLRLCCLRVGVPHAVTFWDRDPTEEELCGIGRAVERHPAFPEGINFDIAVPLAEDAFRIFTWERGAGHTLACGTGCCALAAAARLCGRSSAKRIRIEAEGGILTVEIRPDGGLLLSGPAQRICAGRFYPPQEGVAPWDDGVGAGGRQEGD